MSTSKTFKKMSLVSAAKPHPVLGHSAFQHLRLRDIREKVFKYREFPFLNWA
jgi:hypothetical protein